MRILFDECLVGFRGVNKTFFFEIQVTEIHVDDVAEFRMAACNQEFVDAPGAVHVGKTDTEYAEGIFNELSLGAAQILEAVVAILNIDTRQFAIQQIEKWFKAGAVPGQFELRPALFV